MDKIPLHSGSKNAQKYYKKSSKTSLKEYIIIFISKDAKIQKEMDLSLF